MAGFPVGPSNVSGLNNSFGDRVKESIAIFRMVVVPAEVDHLVGLVFVLRSHLPSNCRIPDTAKLYQIRVYSWFDAEHDLNR